MAFVRFIVAHGDGRTGASTGLLAAAYALQREGTLPKGRREQLRTLLLWFESQVRVPERFNRSSSKGYYRREAKGLSWFRDSATECLTRMHQIKSIVEESGSRVHMLLEERVGYVVYEDEIQVVAEPFADTRTEP